LFSNRFNSVCMVRTIVETNLTSQTVTQLFHRRWSCQCTEMSILPLRLGGFKNLWALRQNFEYKKLRQFPDGAWKF